MLPRLQLRKPVLKGIRVVLSTARCQNSSSSGRRYSAAAGHLQDLQRILSPAQVLTDPADVEKYVIDWTRSYRAGSTHKAVVCLPTSTQQVSALLSFCHAQHIAVVTQGGNTGLVGGAVPLDLGELILSMEKMNRIIDVDVHSSCVTVEAGCVLQQLAMHCEEQHFLVPLDLGAKGSCMIGGNVATNAGGLRVVKYGSLYANILGLEVVKADGTVLDMLRSLYKDNTGYPLRQLFIGSEGTLGIITKVVMRLYPKPKSSHVILAKVASFRDVPQVLLQARQNLSENLSAFEFMDTRSLASVRKISPHLLERIQDSGVLPVDCNFTEWSTAPQSAVNSHNTANTGLEAEQGLPGEITILIEASGSDAEIDQLRIDKFLSQLLEPSGGEKSVVTSAILSADGSQEQALWHIRENVPVSLMQVTRQPAVKYNDICSLFARKLYKYDISLSLESTPSYLFRLKEALLADRSSFCGKQCLPFLVVGINTSNEQHIEGLLQQAVNDGSFPVVCVLEFCNFGHAGDKNLHLNIIAHFYAQNADTLQAHKTTTAAWIQHVHSRLDRYIYPFLVELKGSVSAEHGIGQQKVSALSLYKSQEELAVMRQIKCVFDPSNILNPGKVLSLPEK